MSDDDFKAYSFPYADEVHNADALSLQDDLIDDIDLTDPDFDDLDLIKDELESKNTTSETEEEAQARIKEGNLLLLARGLNKSYIQGAQELKILNNVDLRIYSGEITALVGPSGSGKSTLLHILGLLDSTTSGQIIMGGRDISRLPDTMRTKLRNDHIGFVYQFHHLLPEFTALENVALPQIIKGVKKKAAEEKAADLLEQMGLSHRLQHRPATLSGGEQQRVAIARALINDPYLLFADEPTGNLDPETSEEVFEILLDQVRSKGVGALIATHNLDLAQSMDRILEVKSGRILPY